jgi:uncharacterized membrane protein YgcG
MPTLMRLLVALALGLCLAGMSARAVGAQDRAVSYDRIVATYEVLPDGRVRVVEEQTVDFRGGPFTTGYARLATRGASAIHVTDVGEREPDVAYVPGRDAPGTYAVDQDGEAVTVRWWFAPTTDARRRFVLAYEIAGAVRFYEGGDQLWWQAIRADQPATREAVVTVSLPDTVPAISQAAGYRLPDGRRLPMEQVDARTARLKANDIPRGDAIELRVQWPHGLVLGTPSPFQSQLDASRAAEQARIEAVRSPAAIVLSLALGLLAFLVLVGGAFGLYLLWYRRGRDAVVDLPVDYLAEPPTALAPGLVGVLVDESVDLRDILATLLDLCRRGEARLEERTEEGFLGLMGRQDFILERTPTGMALADHEVAVLDAFLDGAERRAFSDLRERFHERLPGLHRRMFAALVGAGLLDAEPDQVRGRYRLLALGGAAVAALLLCGAVPFMGTLPMILVLPIVVFILSAATFVLAHYMPRKTPAGAEAAARWRAFRQYLRDIDRYRDLHEARDVFDRYLPFAVAFGIEDTWIRRFAAAGAEGPPWFAPDPTRPSAWGPPPHGWGAGTGGAGGMGEAAGGGDLPDLQRTSEGLGRGLQGMSGALASMLNSAAAVMVSQPASSGGSGWSGGGWSGGGFSGGGGGGGGGGGFG